MPTQTPLYEIQDTLTTIEATINAIDAEIKRLTALGVYSAIPRQVYEDKFGNDYLYLIFPYASSGGYMGPNGKRKVYIGRQKDAIAKAEAAINRTHQILNLRSDLATLTSHQRRISEGINAALYTSRSAPRLSGPIPYQ